MAGRNREISYWLIVSAFMSVAYTWCRWGEVHHGFHQAVNPAYSNFLSCTSRSKVASSFQCPYTLALSRPLIACAHIFKARSGYSADHADISNGHQGQKQGALRQFSNQRNYIHLGFDSRFGDLGHHYPCLGILNPLRFGCRHMVEWCGVLRCLIFGLADIGAYEAAGRANPVQLYPFLQRLQWQPGDPDDPMMTFGTRLLVAQNFSALPMWVTKPSRLRLWLFRTKGFFALLHESQRLVNSSAFLGYAPVRYYKCLLWCGWRPMCPWQQFRCISRSWTALLNKMRRISKMPSTILAISSFHFYDLLP